MHWPSNTRLSISRHSLEMVFPSREGKTVPRLAAVLLGMCIKKITKIKKAKYNIFDLHPYQ